MPNADERFLRVRDVRGRVPQGLSAEQAPIHATTDLVGLRMTGPLIDAIDAWRLEQSTTVSRSEAIRCFVKFALSAAPVLVMWSGDPRLEEDRRLILQDLTASYQSPRAR